VGNRGVLCFFFNKGTYAGITDARVLALNSGGRFCGQVGEVISRDIAMKVVK
jgi:hypothetical protein